MWGEERDSKLRRRRRSYSAQAYVNCLQVSGEGMNYFNAIIVSCMGDTDLCYKWTGQDCFPFWDKMMQRERGGTEKENGVQEGKT
jgi:hypothetical protein